MDSQDLNADGRNVGAAWRSSGLRSAQRPIWMGQQQHPGVPLYNMAFAFDIDAELDPGLLERAVQATIAESDALRTQVDSAGGVPELRVADRLPINLDHVRLQDRANPYPTWIQRCEERTRRPFDLSRCLVDTAWADLGEGHTGWYLNLHHLITDGWGFIATVQRVSHHYQMLTQGQGDSHSATPCYYAASAAGVMDADKAYWRDVVRRLPAPPALYGVPAPLDIPQTERNTLLLTPAEMAALDEVCAAPGFQSFTLDLSRFAVFSTLLLAWAHRVSGSEKLAMDLPIPNRPTRELQQTIGLFMEMVPFSVTVQSDDTFQSLALRVQKASREALLHAGPGALTDAGPGRGSLVLNYVPTAFGAFAGHGMRAQWVHPGHGDAHHLVRLQVHDFDQRGALTLHFDANPAVMADRHGKRAMDHYHALLTVLLKDSRTRISEVNLLGEAEYHSVVVDYNQGRGVPLPGDTVVDRFRRQVDHQSDAVALCFQEQSITYGELAERIRVWTVRLAMAGVTSGDRVGICLRRSPDYVAALWAILESGCAYVPLDPRYPADRLTFMIDDAGLPVVVTDGPGGAVLGGTSAGLVLADSPAPPATSIPALPPPRPADLAYVIYTSGSTGQPKGVPIPHHGLMDYIDWAERCYLRGERMAFPLFTSLSFDLTVTSLFLPLVSGGSLIIYPETDEPVDTGLLDVVRDNRVDFVKATPSQLGWLKGMDLSQSRIRRLIVGGEDFKTSLARSVEEQIGSPDLEIYNEYGPTEAVVGCMVHRFDATADGGGSVPIGKPSDHVRLYILDARGAPVPEGVAGELCINRPGMTSGYLNQDGLNRECFFDDPFVPGERLYRSGDRVRFVRPHVMGYLGRIDRQVKVNGVRIEPGEIESAIREQSGIEACVVALKPVRPRPRATGDERCVRCGIPANVPDTHLDGEGVCSTCRDYAETRDHAEAYFKQPEDLVALRDRGRAAHPDAAYDGLMLLSGGKDSTYALCRLVDMGWRIYAVSFDNGYISEEAMANVRRVAEALGVDFEFATVEAMPEVFRESLTRYSNVCQGCFKAIYTLGYNRAADLGIPVILTGLSRGQLFETRLTPNLFRDGRFTPDSVDRAVLEARRLYHRENDEVSRRLDTTRFRNDAFFEHIQVVDFYRYVHASLSEMLDYIRRRVPWERPTDTGRSTNCLINDLGIYIHQKERGYHNYAHPYSWDVRLGLKTRDQAIQELDDELDMDRVQSMLHEVGYDEDRLAAQQDARQLVAYCTGTSEWTETELRAQLADRLPASHVPARFLRLEQIPLTVNGKADLEALPVPDPEAHADGASLVPPEGDLEERLAGIWEQVLHRAHVGATDNFFELGGASLQAMEAMFQICNTFDLDIAPHVLFRNPTVRELAGHIESAIRQEIEALSEEEASRLADESAGS